jgi:hypothetical protein
MACRMALLWLGMGVEDVRFGRFFRRAGTGLVRFGLVIVVVGFWEFVMKQIGKLWLFFFLSYKFMSQRCRLLPILSAE